MRRMPYKSAAAPTSHTATDPAKFNVVCHYKPNLLSQTDSDAALLQIQIERTVQYKLQTLKFKDQRTDAFFATVNQMFVGSSQLPTTAKSSR